MSVVFLPTRVSVVVGKVNVPVFMMVAMVGDINVLLVNVSTVPLVTTVSLTSGKVIVLSVV